MAITLQPVNAVVSPVSTNTSALSSSDSEPNSSFSALFGDLMNSSASKLAQEQLSDKDLLKVDDETDAGALVDPAAQGLLAGFGVQQALAQNTLATVEVKGASSELGAAVDAALASKAKADQALELGADGGVAANGNKAAKAGGVLPDLAANLAASADDLSSRHTLADLKPEVISSVVLGATPAAANHAASAQNSQASMSMQLTASQFAIAEPVGGTRWADALGQKALFMVGQKIQSAEMHLNPPNLGPLEVKMVLDGDKSSINFVTSQAAVRDALQQSLPRLQQVMADNGMASINVHVQLGQSQQQASNTQQQSGRQNSNKETQEGIVKEVSVASASPRWRSHQTYGSVRGVDVFA